MSDIIKLDFNLMDEMSKTLLQGSEHLQDVMQEMQSIANSLEDGALLGRGGVAFTEAIRDALCPAISRLIDKFNEMARDVQDAANEFRGSGGVEETVAKTFS
jgi:WXG100 family type VII secretion target